MPIIDPKNMDFSDDNIIMILSGLPGVGKTTLACSAPNVLIVDIDKGIKRVNPSHRQNVLTVANHEELIEDIKSSEFRKYKTIAIDTTGQFIESLKEWAYRTDPSARKKNGGFSQQGFGVVKSEFLRVSAGLKKHHDVIYMFHVTKDKTRDNEVFYELMCEGSAKQLVWIPADLGAYLQIVGGERYVCFSPTQEYSAKASYGIKGMIKVPELDKATPNDFMTKLFATVKNNMKNEAIEAKKANIEYKNVMTQGGAIIDGIEIAQDAQNAVNALRELPESLTSRAELSSALKSHLTAAGIKWNKETKCYE